MSRGWVLVLLATGCSSLLGLHGVRDDDRDGDRIPDDVDNCPDVPNPDQSDIDGNGVGDLCDGCSSPDPSDADGDGIPDACDGCDNRLPDNNGDGVPDACEHANLCPGCTPCAVGPFHDEDGDQIPDGCDLCPAVASVNSDDADGDRVGDSCDTSATASEQLFDPFLTLNPAWYSTGPWALTGDSISIALDGSATTNVRQLGSAFRNFSIQSHMTGGSTNTGIPAIMSIYAADNQNPDLAVLRAQCTLVISTGAPSLLARATDASGPKSSFALPRGAGPWTVKLTVSMGLVKCDAVADDDPLPITAELTSFNTAEVYLTGIAASGGGTVRFDYFDLVTDVH